MTFRARKAAALKNKAALPAAISAVAEYIGHQRREEVRMASRFVLSDYVGQAMAQAVFDKLEDGTFTGRIPPCQGVIAFGGSLRDCENELQSTLEDWILLGLRLGHPLPAFRP
jgi:predicted RNase H-like HicB family nuclease